MSCLQAFRSLVLVLLAICGGCQSVGPVTVAHDRIDYSEAIAESWKHQTLLNVIKLRYADPPVFVDVGQIIGGYSLETSLEVGASRGSLLSTQSLGSGGRYTDRPTITYLPMTGNRFLNGLITPVAPASLFSAIQAGWPADVILLIGVGAINGIQNEDFASGQYRGADARFSRLVELVEALQQAGRIRFRVEVDANGSATLLTFDDSRSEASPAKVELQSLLGLATDTQDFEIVFGDAARSNREIAIRTRSLLNVLQLMSARADIPDRDVTEGRASVGASSEATGGIGGFRIRSADSEPPDAFVAVEYREKWFYIDDRDFLSKRLFALLMMLFTLADTGADREGPVITVPAQ